MSLNASTKFRGFLSHVDHHMSCTVILLVFITLGFPAQVEGWGKLNERPVEDPYRSARKMSYDYFFRPVKHPNDQPFVEYGDGQFVSASMQTEDAFAYQLPSSEFEYGDEGYSSTGDEAYVQPSLENSRDRQVSATFTDENEPCPGGKNCPDAISEEVKKVLMVEKVKQNLLKQLNMRKPPNVSGTIDYDSPPIKLFLKKHGLKKDRLLEDDLENEPAETAKETVLSYAKPRK